MTTSTTKVSPLRLENIVTKRDAFELRINHLELKPGEVACVVGPNGGGKTTLLMTILGLLPHDGQCFVEGQPYDGSQAMLKTKIGFIPDDPELLFDELTAREQWAVSASVLGRLLRGVTRESVAVRAAELAQSLSFEPPTAVAGTYSHGMRKKTQMVAALLGTPSLIIADELRNGLDPIAIKQSERLMERERNRGAAILATTHDLWWAQRFADYIYILHQGQLVASGTLKQILKRGDKSLEDAFFRIIGIKV